LPDLQIVNTAAAQSNRQDVADFVKCRCDDRRNDPRERQNKQQ
jgi:hypothetical protein